MSEISAISEVVQNYFIGTYEGNEALLRQIFHPDASIGGNLNGVLCHWSVNEFITRILSQPSAAQKNEKFDKQILLLDHVGEAAIVKARAVVGDYVLADYITLLKMDGHWLIRNKSFTTI